MLDAALIYLNELVLEDGYEFPDACSKASMVYGVDYDQLREAYDNQ